MTSKLAFSPLKEASVSSALSIKAFSESSHSIKILKFIVVMFVYLDIIPPNEMQIFLLKILTTNERYHRMQLVLRAMNNISRRIPVRDK